MELTVRIGDAPTKDQQIQDIDGEDLLNVKSYLRRRKYRLGRGEVGNIFKSSVQEAAQ